MNLIFTIAILLMVPASLYAMKNNPDFYQLKIYHLKNNEQVKQVDEYLERAYLPALHRLGIKNIGVFKPIANDTAAIKFMYILIPFGSAAEWAMTDQKLTKDSAFTSASKSFTAATPGEAPYERTESILLEAFSRQEHLLLPPTKSTERIFELRSYESPTENLSEKKMAMFNTGEIDIFKRLGFNPVFYARVLSGGQMPNFMYMPVFSSVEERDAQWKVFGNDAQWKEISSKPENENKVSVSHIDSILMQATSYSDY